MDTEPNFNDLLRYDADTGRLYWKVRVSRSIHAGAEAGCASARGYHRVKVKGKVYGAHRLAWLLTYGAWPTHDIDHIDGDPSNNKLSNLRDVTPSINHRNARRQSNNTSGIAGVLLHCADSHPAWVAHWCDDAGKLHGKHFSMRKFGEEAAKQLAIEYRAARVKELGGYSARHGT